MNTQSIWSYLKCLYLWQNFQTNICKSIENRTLRDTRSVFKWGVPEIGVVQNRVSGRILVKLEVRISCRHLGKVPQESLIYIKSFITLVSKIEKTSRSKGLPFLSTNN